MSEQPGLIDPTAPIGELSAIEQRVLGALLEKQVTVPSTYPLTLNALRTACNQTSSREPVTAYEDAEIEECARGLKKRELLRIVVPDRGVRTLKFHQRLDEALDLEPAERAILTVLLLRGPNAPGELKTRTERLHRFDDRAAVEEELARMARRGLVRELPRKAGQHDARWVHLLGAPPAPAAGVAPADAVDREIVLAAGAERRDEKVRASYDRAATAYAAGQARDLGERIFDAWILDRIAEEVAPGPVADVGTGAGKVAGYLAEQGLEVVGYDISPGMVAQAQARWAEATFDVGDLRALMRPPAASGWAAITSWYSLVYLAPSELPEAVAALARVLNPGGLLVLALHAGAEVRHESELAGQPVDMDLVLHDPQAVRAAVTAAGLTVREWYVRGPVDGEYPTDRLYVLAEKA